MHHEVQNGVLDLQALSGCLRNAKGKSELHCFGVLAVWMKICFIVLRYLDSDTTNEHLSCKRFFAACVSDFHCFITLNILPSVTFLPGVLASLIIT